MKLMHKKTGEVCSSREFNIHTCTPQEIIVYGSDWVDTVYMSSYDAVLHDGSREDLMQAEKDGDVVVDDTNHCFRLKEVACGRRS